MRCLSTTAGVMVSAGFCHLLGEALKQMPKMQARRRRAAYRCGAAGGLWRVACGGSAGVACSGGARAPAGICPAHAPCRLPHLPAPPLQCPLRPAPPFFPRAACHLPSACAFPPAQFPLAPFLCGVGYLFTLVADRIAASASGHSHGGCAHHSLPTKGPAVDSCTAVEVLAGAAPTGVGRDGRRAGGHACGCCLALSADAVCPPDTSPIPRSLPTSCPPPPCLSRRGHSRARRAGSTRAPGEAQQRARGSRPAGAQPLAAPQQQSAARRRRRVGAAAQRRAGAGRQRRPLAAHAAAQRRRGARRGAGPRQRQRRPAPRRRRRQQRRPASRRQRRQQRRALRPAPQPPAAARPGGRGAARAGGLAWRQPRRQPAGRRRAGRGHGAPPQHRRLHRGRRTGRTAAAGAAGQQRELEFRAGAPRGVRGAAAGRRGGRARRGRRSRRQARLLPDGHADGGGALLSLFAGGRSNGGAADHQVWGAEGRVWRRGTEATTTVGPECRSMHACCMWTPPPALVSHFFCNTPAGCHGFAPTYLHFTGTNGFFTSPPPPAATPSTSSSRL